MGHPHNFGSTVRIFCKFCTMKRANKYIKVIILVCIKKNFQDKWAILCPKMAHPDNSGSTLRVLLRFCRIKGANRYMKFYCFLRKNFILGNLIFLALKPFFTVWLGMVEIEPGHCYYWILKQSGHDYFHDYCWILKQSGHD